MKIKFRRISRPFIPPQPLEPRLLLTAIPTTIQLFDTATQVQVGDAITVTALVMTTDGQPLDGQVVQLTDNNRLVIAAAPVSEGIATFNWIPVTGGLHELEARFSPQDSFDGAASNAVDINVYRLAAKIDLETKTLPGAAVVEVSVAGASPTSAAPTGAVNIYDGPDGSHRLGTVAIGGHARLALSAGAHTLTARFDGDGAFYPATASVVVTIPGASIAAATAPAAPAPAASTPAPATHHPAAAALPPALILDLDPAAPALRFDAALPVAPQQSLMSGTAAGTSESGENQFGLQLPEYRQFYEFQLPPSIVPPQTPPAGDGGDPASPGDAASGSVAPLASPPQDPVEAPVPAGSPEKRQPHDSRPSTRQDSTPDGRAWKRSGESQAASE